MWIIKLLLVISPIAILRAEINGLQNDLNNGYSYERPESVPAKLAFYLNIPAGHDATPYIAKTNEGPFNQQQHQQFNQHHHLPQVVPENHEISVNSIQHQFDEQLKQYIPPPPPTPSQPFFQQNSGFRPIHPSIHQQQNLPFIQENTGLVLSNPSHQQQNGGYNNQFSGHQYQQHSFGVPQQRVQFQVEPRNINSVNFHQQQIPFQFPSQNQNSPTPSQELQPPPSVISTNSQPSEPNHRFMASISNSFNAPLPFPFGVVPIKFDPLPLKTHLRQEKLLPITSYEAKVFYKK